jgi:hypothetical protein
MIPFTGLVTCLYVPLQKLTQGIGSGITLYMTFEYISNFTVSIDNSTPIQFLFYRSGLPALYNFTAYDQQSLQFGNHNLDLKQLDTNETGDSAHNSNFLFDYAVINEMEPFPNATSSLDAAATTSSASAPNATFSLAPGATTSSASAPQSKTEDAGAIAGGVIGGLIVLACLCYLVFFYRRRARSMVYDSPPERNFLVEEANIFPYMLHSFNPNALQDISTDGPVATTSLMQHPSAVIPTSMPPLFPPKPPAFGEPPFPGPSSGGPPFPVPSSADNTSAALPSLLLPASLPQQHADGSVVATPTLSDNQLSLLHRLLDSNTPGPVLAAVAQSMVLGSRERGHLEPADSVPPPEYTPTADYM